MTPDRHQQIKRLFLAAVERAPHEAKAFLDGACAADDDLRREVQSLLDHHRTHTLLESTAHGTGALLGTALASTQATEPAPEPTGGDHSTRPAGTMIAGRYRLVAQLGRGG